MFQSIHVFETRNTKILFFQWAEKMNLYERLLNAKWFVFVFVFVFVNFWGGTFGLWNKETEKHSASWRIV